MIQDKLRGCVENPIFRDLKSPPIGYSMFSYALSIMRDSFMYTHLDSYFYQRTTQNYSNTFQLVRTDMVQNHSNIFLLYKSYGHISAVI